MMQNVLLISAKTSNSYEEVMRMPYIAFLCFLHHLKNLELESYNMNTSIAQQSKQPVNNILYRTEPDMNKIRPLINSGNKGGV